MAVQDEAEVEKEELEKLANLLRTSGCVDFDSLNPQTQTVALVGFYMQCFALLEAQLEYTIQSALGVGPFQALIIRQNMMVRDKINVLKAASNLLLADGAKSKALAVAQKLRSIAETRNRVVHSTFSASDDGKGVAFQITHKLELRSADQVWSINHFMDKVREMLGVSNDLKSLSKKFEAANVLFFGDPNAALNKLDLLTLISIDED